MYLFGDFLESAVKAAGYADLKAFSKVAGVSQPQLSRIRNELRTPPLDLVDGWADVLGLKADARHEFKMLAGLAHVKDPEVRKLIVGELTALRQKSERQGETISALRTRLSALETKKK